MGCWNGTCQISNLHVMSGQDVAVFMLAENGTPSDHCYSSTFYSPCPIPFYGKYNDYGAVEDCTGIGVDIVVGAIREQLYEFYQGPNSCHDCEVTKDKFNLELLFEADHEGRLGIQQGYKWDGDAHDARELERQRTDKGLSESQMKELDRLANKIKKVDTFRAVTHVIIHGDIFKAILEKYYIESYVGDGKGDCGYDNAYKKTTFQHLLDDIPAYIEGIKKAAEDTSEEGMLAAQRRRYGMGDNDNYRDPNQVVRRLSYMTGSGSSEKYSIVNINEYIGVITEGKNWDLLAAFVEELMVTSWINDYMSLTRKHWTKMTGAGSQCNERLGYEVLANATLDILKAEKAEYGDEDEDEEE